MRDLGLVCIAIGFCVPIYKIFFYPGYISPEVTHYIIGFILVMLGGLLTKGY